MEKLLESSAREVLIDTVDGYALIKKDYGQKGFLYSVFDPEGVLVFSWRSFLDAEKSKNLKKSGVYQLFLELIKEDKTGEYKHNDYDDFDPYIEDEEENQNLDYGEDVYYDDYDDYDYDDYDDYDDYHYGYSNKSKSNWPSRSYYSDYLPFYGYGGYHYEPPKREKGFLEKLNKSNTLVFHKDDPSTRMLCQVYEGKDWDVLTTSCYRIDEEELKQLFEIHDRLVFLGHGTTSGLIGMFGPEVAPYMKGKKIFAIWCNADGYFKQHGIGQGQFVTGNMPSEVWECSSAGCGKISKELMLENITYWSKLCADVTERCLEGDVKSSVDYIRKNYLELYGNHPVTIYNAIRTQVLGEDEPLPKYEFKGKPLEPVDYPVANFDEEAFLKNPTPKASDCPKTTSAEAEDIVEPEVLDKDDIRYPERRTNFDYWWEKDDENDD